MKIDEAIAHARKKANEMYTQGMLCHANPNDEKLDGIIDCAREQEQLAEWLEELKAFKENKWTTIYFRRGYKKAENDYHAQSEKDRQSSYDCGYEVGYAKAIDDFTEKSMEKLTEYDLKHVYPHICDCKVILRDVAEQLKAGDTDAGN